MRKASKLHTQAALALAYARQDKQTEEAKRKRCAMLLYGLLDGDQLQMLAFALAMGRENAKALTDCSAWKKLQKEECE